MTNGIVAVHKPEGISSARVVARVKKALGVKKVGHTGTLDPFATGLLLCAINQGTRISRFFLGGDKRYTARITLGVETDTYDRTGQALATAPESVMELLTEEMVRTAVAQFVGVQAQVPPVYSALKHNGQPLYKLARQGKAVTKPPRQIEVYEMVVTNVDLPHVDVDIFCSTGTYIRSLAFDIGRKLGCGAHLSELCRTRSSAFDLENAIELEALESLSREDALKAITPLAVCLGFLPGVVVGDDIIRKVGFGQALSREEIGFVPTSPDQFIRILDSENSLLAIVQLPENAENYNYSCVFPN